MVHLRHAIAAGAVIALLIGCSAPPDRHASAAPEPPLQSVTHYGPRTELFLEFPILRVGSESPFAAHVTKLGDFKPLDAGRVAVVLAQGNGPEERFEASSPTVPGIFRPIAKPAFSGERRLVVEIATADGVEQHDLGTVTIAAADSAEVAEPPQASQPAIRFLKEQQWLTEFATEAVAEHTVRASLAANGTITARADGEAVVAAPLPGRLVDGGAEFPRLGMPAARDQVLAAIAPRLGGDVDVATLKLTLEQATIARDHARRERHRLEALLVAQAVPERRVFEARHEEASTDAAVAAAEQRLQQFRGTRRAEASDALAMIELRSPIDGTVVAVEAAPGAFVEEGRELFRIVNLGRVWLRVQIPEADVARVQGASGAWFTVDGFPSPFQIDPQHGGKLVALGGVIDPESRTAPLVFELDNPDGALRVGSFARVHVLVGEPLTALAIPAAAVIYDGGQPVVYVRSGGEAFERRPVRLGIRDGDRVQVLDGLTAGERVVTRGAYQVRLAGASGAIPADGHVH